MVKKTPIVCVTGSIATGKSTLVGPLATCLDAVAYYERNDTNPAYAASLKEPKRWAFESELTFIVDSLENWSQARKTERIAILERCPADSVAVFGASRLAHNEISEREFQLLCRCVRLTIFNGGGYEFR